MPLGLSTPIFNKKSHWTRLVECHKLPIVLSNVTTVESLRHSTARVESDFLLEIGILRAKGITKSVPNLEVVCDPAPSTTLSI